MPMTPPAPYTMVSLAVLALISTAIATAQQLSSQWTTFPLPIRRVAVIGAGPSGLQAAANLMAANLSVRLFERAPSPGGNWFFTEDTPVREAYPNDTIRNTTPIPPNLPHTRYHEEGKDGIKLDYLWREHWQPSPVWYDLHTNGPSSATELHGVKYPANTPWLASVHDVQRHVRSYASLHGLNIGDRPITPSSAPVASYSTRVESISKCNETATWTLTLRRLEWLRESGRIKEDLWTEDFDAVVVAVGYFSTPSVPAIPGLSNWSTAIKNGQYSVYHAQAFRHPERYAGKKILIVGASWSATDIARTIAPFTSRLVASIRPNPLRDAYGLDIMFSFPTETEIVPEILAFEPLDEHEIGINTGVIRLVDGSYLTDIDEIILATGYHGNTFLPDLVDPKTLSNVHWTGHYIHDPTLAYATVRPWIEGHYQSAAFARVWTEKARLPSQEEMLRVYREGKLRCADGFNVLAFEGQQRQYVAWLNGEALELGGQLFDMPPVQIREDVAYFLNAHWKKNFVNHEDFTRFDDIPSNEWPKCGTLMGAW
ncbi:FAD/NAD-P-binding domain-containing protein [Roridomyces roridus]|uniref:FAD/NAD-P-binding domain-containing protein n=1 Tax=Roridomyces roridus TaxID=1738132 RepID=A0AAD7B366_9AGAR|nr:FAD/NAD-P-binding domain-containing protein [Roridomyces roridus]